MNYVADLLYKPTAIPGNYWKNTSGNGVIRDFVEHTDWGIPDRFEVLMTGNFLFPEIIID